MRQIKNFVYSVIATDQSPYLCRVFSKYFKALSKTVFISMWLTPKYVRKKNKAV